MIGTLRGPGTGPLPPTVAAAGHASLLDGGITSQLPASTATVTYGPDRASYEQSRS